jgi:hypothetical protein
MIKFKFECEQPFDNETSNVTWVSKRHVTKQDSQPVVGLMFHKVTSRIKKSFSKSESSENN